MASGGVVDPGWVFGRQGVAVSLVELSKALRVPSTRAVRLNANRASLQADKKRLRLLVRR